MVDWSLLSQYIDIKEIRWNPSYPWVKRSIARNEGITYDDVIRYGLHLEPWWPVVAEAVSRNVPMQDIRDHPDFRWDLEGVAQNEGLTLDDVLNLVLPRAIIPTDFREHDEYVYDDDELWARGWLHGHANTPTPRWNWRHLTRTLPGSVIEANPDLPWVIDMEVTYPSLHVSEIMAYPRREWDWYNVSHAEGVTLDMILHDLDLPNAAGDPDWYHLGNVVPMEEIRADGEFQLEEVIGNPGLTVDDVLYWNT